MNAKLQVRPGLLERLRVTRNIPSEEIQARMIGVDRTTLRRVDQGGVPSGAFIAGMVVAFQMGIGEMFEVVTDEVTTRERLVA